MLKINKKVEYALIALKFMADKKETCPLTSAREICDHFDAPFDTTAKVMQMMNNHDILKSVKGIKGGYSLNRSLEDITYAELAAVVEGKSARGRMCVSQKGTCELMEKCNIVTPVELLNKKLNQFLETLTLKELLQGTDFNPHKSGRKASSSEINA